MYGRLRNKIPSLRIKEPPLIPSWTPTPRFLLLSSLPLTARLKKLPEYSMRHSAPVTAQKKPGLSHLSVDLL